MKVNKPFVEAMRQATQLVRTRGPTAATRFIQGLFRSRGPTPTAPTSDASAEDFVDTVVEVLDPAPTHTPHAEKVPAELPGEPGQFLNRHFSGQAGARNYKLYVPSRYVGEPLPLVVMLHGCTQDPDDFAIGTRANRWAESRRCLVAYPEQMQRANSHRCWNWFRPVNQQAGHGEPAIIAGITQQIIDEYQIDAQRVYVAGLSAGGAMAAIMGQAYPELFAAVGIHSGVPVGAAYDVPSALAVMKTGQSLVRGAAVPNRAEARSSQRMVPFIVLHGDADRTVNPANAKRLVDDAVEANRLLTAGSPLSTSAVVQDETPDSYGYRRTTYAAANGSSVIELLEIHNAGHAWSGGNTAGSHTDARGPDATKAMLDFFEHHTARAIEATPDVVDSAASM